MNSIMRGRNSMIQITLNEEELKAMYLAEVHKKLEEFEAELILLDSKQLCKMLSLSWPTVQQTFLADPDFPQMRIGTKWVFNKREIQEYIDTWSVKYRKRT
jgi:predicted DNA-binding transcriptional regulator AlpA